MCPEQQLLVSAEAGLFTFDLRNPGIILDRYETLAQVADEINSISPFTFEGQRLIALSDDSGAVTLLNYGNTGEAR
jgi:hypothetical protein